MHDLMTCNHLYFPPLFSVKADPSLKASEEAESAAGLGPDLTASVETTYSEQSSSSAGSTSSSDQPIYFRYWNIYSPKIWFCLKERVKILIASLPLLFSGSFVSPLKCLSGWTIMANMSSLNRWEVFQTAHLSLSLRRKDFFVFDPEFSRFTVFSHSFSPGLCSQGTFAGILIGLAQLNCSELKLKRLCCRHG